jgi:hypothetical protein
MGLIASEFGTERRGSPNLQFIHRHIQCWLMAMLENIVTLDETMVCHFTPDTKKQTIEWVKKEQPGPVKMKVRASWTKQMQ